MESYPEHLVERNVLLILLRRFQFYKRIRESLGQSQFGVFVQYEKGI